MLGALIGWAKAYLLISGLMFCVLFTGFLILKVKYALLLAFIVALIDVFPVLGTGSVLVPWAIFSLVSGNARLGGSLLVLYGVATLLHEFAEAKLVGKSNQDLIDSRESSPASLKRASLSTCSRGSPTAVAMRV